MKFSVFLSFLPFTLSFPHSPYRPSFYSNVSIPPDSHFQKFPLFLVQGGSLTYIWKFSVSEITEYGSSNDSAHYTDDFKAKLANTLSTDWPIILESVPFQLATRNLIKLSLNTLETYIILRLGKNNKYKAFYWIGNKSGLVQRQLTARFVVRMIHDISMQIEGANLAHFSREEEFKESPEFQKIFRRRMVNKISRIFKISGKSGESIMEVPLRKEELNKTDIFVLSSGENIHIWNTNPNKNNPNKIRTAIALANYIKNEKPVLKSEILENSELPSEETILRHLRNIPSSSQLHRDPSSTTMNEQDQLLLYEFFLLNKRVLSKEIYTRPLTLQSFGEDKTYLMMASRTGNIFLIIGLNAHETQIEQATAAAEIINWFTPCYEWKKVTIIRNMDCLPAHFLVNFPEKQNILQQYEPN